MRKRIHRNVYSGSTGVPPSSGLVRRARNMKDWSLLDEDEKVEILDRCVGHLFNCNNLTEEDADEVFAGSLDLRNSTYAGEINPNDPIAEKIKNAKYFVTEEGMFFNLMTVIMMIRDNEISSAKAYDENGSSLGAIRIASMPKWGIKYEDFPHD